MSFGQISGQISVVAYGREPWFATKLPECSSRPSYLPRPKTIDSYDSISDVFRASPTLCSAASRSGAATIVDWFPSTLAIDGFIHRSAPKSRTPTEI